MHILKPNQYPKALRGYPQIRGVCYGGCRFGRTLISAAHSHSSVGHYDYGWICVREKYLLKTELLMKHELAHLLAGYDAGHGDEWRKKLLGIGGSIDPFPIAKTFGTLFKKREEMWCYCSRCTHIRKANNEDK